MRGQNPPLKDYQPLQLLTHFEMALDLNAVDMRSVGHRFLAFKIEFPRKKSAISAIPAEVCASAIGPGLSGPVVKSFSKFDGR